MPNKKWAKYLVSNPQYTTLMFYNSQKGLIELRKFAMLTFMVYYTKITKIQISNV